MAQEYIAQFGNLAKAGNTLILPSDLADLADIAGSLTVSILRQSRRLYGCGLLKGA